MILFLCDTSHRSLDGVDHHGCIVQIVARILEMRTVKESSGASSISRTFVRCNMLEQCISLDF